MKYSVTVCRTGYGFATFEVEGNSLKEIKDKAIEQAGNYAYSEKSSEYEIDSYHKVEKQMTCSQCGHLKSTPINTGDWFEDGFVNQWSCRRRGNKFIGYTETTSQPKQPQWCPLRQKKGS